MKAVVTDRHMGHDPQFFLVRGQVGRSAEQPERATILKAGAIEAGLSCVNAALHDRQRILDIHSPEYLSFLESASTKWMELAGSSPEVTANVHPNRVDPTYPRSIVGRAGWHMADTACPIGPHTFAAALASADVALTAADMITAGDDKVYALCRPPGHHAYADMAGGFCYLNNCAIAAQALRTRFRRIAILDIDVHHGNGTQQIFYERGDVLTGSIHVDPADYYPFFWGYAHENGQGHGLGSNFNIPLPLGTKDAAWIDAISQGLNRVTLFEPDVLVLALGLDPHENDPLKGMAVTTSGFHQAGGLIARVHLPILVIQEGGYLSTDLGVNLNSFLSGLCQE